MNFSNNIQDDNMKKEVKKRFENEILINSDNSFIMPIFIGFMIGSCSGLLFLLYTWWIT